MAGWNAMTSELTPLAAVAALNLAAAMSPGPAFVLITRTAAASSRSSALKAAAGTVAASVIWAAAALLGLQVILTQAAGLYRVFQVAGGLYLCVIGSVMWRHASDPMPTASGAESHVRGAFTKGLLLGLSNPKVVVFFGTIFTTAFAPSTPAAVKWAALLVVLSNESIWYGSLALCFGSASVQRRYRRVKAGLERIFGALLIVFGGRLVWNGAQS
jgi:threonine efflux protein